VPIVDVPRVLPLAGKGLRVSGYRIRLGVPHVEGLQVAASLIARTVAINYRFHEESLGVEGFVTSARRQLSDLGIQGKLRVPERTDASGQHLPIRRVVRVKGVRIVCYALLVADLKPEESLRLQELGLGGRRRLGCGMFVPARGGENGHDC
jgi:CRISPR-associated endonuclease/helicase Cas3